MKSSHVIPATQARKRLFEIIEEVQDPDSVYMLTQRGYAKAVIISAEHYESLLETIDVFETFPNILETLKESRQEFLKGDYVTLDELMKEYGLPANHKTKRQKTAVKLASVSAAKNLSRTT